MTQHPPQRYLATLASFGSKAQGKFVRFGSVTLQGNSGSWVTIPSDQYHVAYTSGYIVQRSYDDSQAIVDWSAYTTSPFFRATYTVVSGSVVTTYTNETQTFADEVNAQGDSVFFTPIDPDSAVSLEIIRDTPIVSLLNYDKLLAETKSYLDATRAQTRYTGIGYLAGDHPEGEVHLQAFNYNQTKTSDLMLRSDSPVPVFSDNAGNVQNVVPSPNYLIPLGFDVSNNNSALGATTKAFFATFYAWRALNSMTVFWRVTTAGAAGAKMKLAIYDSAGAGGIPLNLLAAPATTVDCTTTGIKSINFSFTPTLNQSQFWLALIGNDVNIAISFVDQIATGSQCGYTATMSAAFTFDNPSPAPTEVSTYPRSLIKVVYPTTQ